MRFFGQYRATEKRQISAKVVLDHIVIKLTFNY